MAALSCACGGSISDVPEDAGKRKDAGYGGQNGADGAYDPDGPPVFVDDVCIDVGRLPPNLACDPFASVPCGIGRGCYPVPPRATGACEPGTYSTVCTQEGDGDQNDPCNDTTECRGSFVCVKSGLGNHCVRLCKVAEFNSCPDGLVCRVLDLTGSGWGGCG